MCGLANPTSDNGSTERTIELEKKGDDTFASRDDRQPQLDLFSIYTPENPEPGWYRHLRR